ncbi:SCO1431 family membrane protein [Streptomyces sp. 21So2-11]|uniref:SCO1431 family membrane protein n=1 Tax=Streptomyces sp. 21So2-11 TaxID=3144408 RepID=UPI00321B8D27
MTNVMYLGAGPAVTVGRLSGDIDCHATEWDPMTAATVNTAESARARTGGPKDGPKVLEHLLGWTLVVLLAMFVTGAGLM